MLFDDLSPERNRGDLCQGIAESLISALSKISGLRVPARTSSFAFKGPDKDVRSIGEKLSVASVLEGSVQVSGSRLRVTTNLIDTADEAVLWSEEFDKELNDVFSIQDEIALKVVEKLRVNLLGEERSKLTRHGTANAEAYELYLKGKHFRYTERPKEMLRAKDYFEEAIRKDPNYAAAYAGHAENCMVLGLYSALPRDEAPLKARQAAEKALEIDPDLSEAHVSLGVVKMVFDWDWKGAEREFQRAITLNPNNLDAHCEYAWLLLRNFRYDQSEQEFIRSQELDPLNSLPLRDMQWLYLSMGLTDKADEVNKKLREIDPFWANTGFKVERSVEDAEKLTQEYGRYPLTLLYLAVAHYQKGNYREATKIIQELEILYEKDRQGNEAYFLAIYFSYTLHDIDKSLMWLNRAVEGRAPALINVSIPIYFTFLHKEPRFQEVLKKVGLK